MNDKQAACDVATLHCKGMYHLVTEDVMWATAEVVPLDVAPKWIKDGTSESNVTQNHEEFIDIVETIYRGARKGRGLVMSPKDRGRGVVLRSQLLRSAAST